MDPMENPFSPGAGTPPPELVGRDSILEEARILLGRSRQKRSAKSMLLTGLRGVGKTVLLHEIKRLADGFDYRSVFIEASENKPLAALLAPHLRGLLFELNRVAGAGNKVKRALVVLRSFVAGIKLSVGDFSLGLDIEPQKGLADSGDLEIDLPNLFTAIGEAAEDRKCAVVILIDEIQYLNQKELGALIMSMHQMQQLQLPVVLLGAGLPVLPGMAGESKSYAERLFSFPAVGVLSEQDAIRALKEPALAKQVIFELPALEEIFNLTKGYPYFLQVWGYETWNLATSSPITLSTVQRATLQAIQRLDADFFRVRFDRLTQAEKNFLRAMAELGSGPQRTSDVAEKLSVKVAGLSPVRAALMRKGMIYSPSHGDIMFTVPLFDQFMIRAIPEFYTSRA